MEDEEASSPIVCLLKAFRTRHAKDPVSRCTRSIPTYLCVTLVEVLTCMAQLLSSCLAWHVQQQQPSVIVT